VGLQCGFGVLSLRKVKRGFLVRDVLQQVVRCLKTGNLHTVVSNKKAPPVKDGAFCCFGDGGNRTRVLKRVPKNFIHKLGLILMSKIRGNKTNPEPSKAA